MLATNNPTPTEGEPGCEDWDQDGDSTNGVQPQPSIGYPGSPGSSLPNTNMENIGGSTVDERNCEGEHWDGQDHLGAGFADNRDGSLTECTGQFVDGVNARYQVALWQCSDPSNSPTSPTRPVGVRYTAQGDNFNLDRGYVYLGVHIFSVGKTSVYAEGCQVVGPHDDPCTTQSIGHGTLAWYGQDDTPLNVLATAISTARLTRAYADDGDCDQSTYYYQAYHQTERACGRDNTAITIDLVG